MRVWSGRGLRAGPSVRRRRQASQQPPARYAQGQAQARGLEYQLADDRDPDAASDASRVAGSLYSVIAPVPKIAPKIGEFNPSRGNTGWRRGALAEWNARSALL